jgi:hypothetical protein
VSFGSAYRLLALPLVLIVAALAIRNAVVNAIATTDPAKAALAWRDHPDVTIGKAMVAIATSAGSGGKVPQSVFGDLGQAAIMAPLSPEPFIVAGIRDDLSGKRREAERALLAAKLRDPRSVPARFFLAQHYLRENNLRGLDEVADITRLSPTAAGAIAPYLAAFAKQPAAHAPLRRILSANPALRSAVLGTLAGDSANAPLVVRLGGLEAGADTPWVASLLHTLIGSGEVRMARSLWAQAAGVETAKIDGLYDGNFSSPKAPPPFNWDLTSSALGLAERRDGRLHVIYYGERDGALARQLVVLGPGSYRLTIPSQGNDRANNLSWSARCVGDTSSEGLASAPAARGLLDFTVPEQCAAVWIELVAHASDMGSQTEMAIGPARLTGLGGQ